MLIPIVGIRHYIDNTEAFLQSLTPDTLVFLTCEDSNPYDSTAIAAWIDGQKVGYVSSDYTLLIRANYPDEKEFRTFVCTNDWALEDNAFYVDAPITSFEFSLEQLTLPLSAFHDIPMPCVLQPRRLSLLHLLEQCDELQAYLEDGKPHPKVAETLLDMAQQLSSFFGSSLSFDDRSLYLRLSGLLMDVIMRDQEADNATKLYHELLLLDDTRRHFAADGASAVEVMESELQAIRAELTPLLKRCEALVQCGLVTKEQLIRENDEWLRALPHHLYADINTAEELALRLLYMRLSTDELYAVYVHLLLHREWQAAPAKPTRVHGKKPHPGLQYWVDGLEDYEKKAAVGKMRDAIASSPNQPTAKLAECIKDLQDKHIIVKELSPIREFTEQLNYLLGTDIKANSLFKFFKRHSKRSTSDVVNPVAPP